MKKVGLGLIGLGSMGKVHLLNCLRLEHANLVGVSDVSRKALNFAKKMGIKNTFYDYRELLNEESLDAVIIALPNYLHAECVKEASEAGKDVFLEKPLSRNVSEGKKIVSTIKKHGVKLMVSYPLRFSSPFRALKAEIISGELGEVQVAHATNVSAGPFSHRSEFDVPRPVPEWWFKSELTGGGALMDLGCHMINLFRWYFGKVSNVRGYMGHRFNVEQEDHAICLLRFEQGQIAVVNVGWFSQKAQIKVELLGTFGHALATYNPPSRIKTAIQLLMKRTPDFSIPYLKEIQHFVHCLKEDLQPTPSGHDALKDLEIITQAYKNQIRLD